MRTARVTVAPYSEEWENAFRAIKAELEAALGELAAGIEHVGSTSVKGMSAKPCIDIERLSEKHSRGCKKIQPHQGGGG